MQFKHLAALVAASAVISTGIGFAFAQAGNPDASTAARKGGGAQLRQLKAIKRAVKSTDRRLASIEQVNRTIAENQVALDSSIDSVRGSVDRVDSGVDRVRSGVDTVGARLGRSVFDTDSVRWLLDRICRHTNELTGGSGIVC